VLRNWEEGDERGKNRERIGKKQGKLFSGFMGIVALSCH
jgi:hypothetical protein